MKKIRTLLGDIEPNELGFTNSHEHLICVPPYWEERNQVDLLLDDYESTKSDMLDFKNNGGNAIVDATAIDYGRRVEEVARLSKETGLHIVGTAGFNKSFLWDAKISDHIKEVYSIKEDTYTEWIEDATIEELTNFVVYEYEHGLEGTNYKAGQLKFGTGYNSITPLEEKVLRAVARAQKITNAPLHSHTEAGTMAIEQAEMLIEEGVDLSRWSIGHMDRNLDYYYYKKLAETGAFLSFDGLGKNKYAPESARIDAIIYLIKEGYEDQIIIGGDMARRSYYKHYDHGLGLGWIPGRWLERFKDELTIAGLNAEEVVEKLFVVNAQRYLSVDV